MKGLSILDRKEIPVTVTAMLLSALDVKVTSTTLENDLRHHPDYPALLSISDVLHGYRVDNISFTTTIDMLDKIPTPFLAQVKSEQSLQDLFVIVSSVTDGAVRYYDPELRRWKEKEISDFRKSWPSGIVLIADADEAVGEQYYEYKRKEENQASLVRYFSCLALPVIAVITGLLRYGRDVLTGDVFPLLFFFATLAGCVTGILLIWYELDAYNPLLQKICSAGQKVNCGAVLNSKASKIAGISWSSIGFSYFAAGLFLLLFTGLARTLVFPLLAWLNVLAVPYVFFSVYYQWRVAKQWCVLCLTVQGILLLQLVTSLSGQWHSMAGFATLLTPDVLIPLMFAWLTPFTAINLLLPMYKIARENKIHKAELQRMKHNPQIFDALLKRQKTFTSDTSGLGITIGNPNARFKIVKICNPYCGPCSQSHIALGSLVYQNPDVQLQIIFFTTGHLKDPQRLPVKHLMAIAEQKDEVLMEKALDDWYLPEKKDYPGFARKYPVTETSQNNDHKLTAMAEWISAVDVFHTPSIFVNGHLLPPSYEVNDLKYFLSV
jgi:uncharacterized membrane protein